MDVFSSEVPVIDFNAYRLSLEKPDPGTFQQLVDDVHSALTTIGFFFIINTDFPQEKVDELFHTSKIFFDLPKEVKLKYPRNKGGQGYVRLEQESTNVRRLHGDLKECFQFNAMSAGDVWPSESESPGFKSAMLKFFYPCLSIHQRLLEVMGHSLKLEDPMYFAKSHVKIQTDSTITLRTLYYPPLSDLEVKDQQVRCGEHSDYGGLTLLFQQKSGLQVRKLDGNYIKVPLIPNAILVNIGDLMQRWTSDVYIAARHCVLLDETPEERRTARQSIAFFGHPDNDVIVECVDKSNKYPPISSLEYLENISKQTYTN